MSRRQRQREGLLLRVFMDRVLTILAIDRVGNLLPGARFEISVNGQRAANTTGGHGFVNIQVDNPEAAIGAKAFYQNYAHEVRVIASDSYTFPIQFPEVQYVSADTRFDNIVFVVGLLLILLTVALAIVFPNPTAFQLRIFSGMFAIATGAFAMKITGMLNVQMNLGARLAVSAAGALAVFLLIYFFVPAH